MLLSVLVVVGPALAFGSGSFSEVAADRGLDADVVADENAYVGVETESAEGYVGGDPVPVLRLTDQLSGELVLESVSSASSIVEVETEPPVVIGESEPSTVRATCQAAGSESAPFTVVAADSSTTVTLDRAVPVTCLEPEVQSAAFNGCETAHIEADDAVYPLTVTIEVDNPSSDGVSTSTETIGSDGKVGPDESGKLVAVEADGERYENPNACVGEGKSGGSVSTTAQSE
ncbi:hypothetical protein BRD06_04050 [Halobacteriales archaeon QS_9_67_15]|nr:MAG: hypothetical protein BRD06_04050 [Halobacteriales archaeon QS_9_67_15]